MNIFQHRGYLGKFEYVEGIEAFHGRVLMVRDVVTFQGTSVRTLKKAFRDSVNDYLEMCVGSEMEPDKSFSGKIHLRLSPDLHRRIAIAAELEGASSLNRFIKLQLEHTISED